MSNLSDSPLHKKFACRNCGKLPYMHFPIFIAGKDEDSRVNMQGCPDKKNRRTHKRYVAPTKHARRVLGFG